VFIPLNDPYGAWRHDIFRILADLAVASRVYSSMTTRLEGYVATTSHSANPDVGWVMRSAWRLGTQQRSSLHGTAAHNPASS